jgi:ABC-type taurine transport system substrate-binding protein
MSTAIRITTVVGLMVLITCCDKTTNTKNEVKLGHTSPLAPFTSTLKSKNQKLKFLKPMNLKTGMSIARELNKDNISIGILGTTSLVMAMLRNRSLELIAVPMIFPKRFDYYIKDLREENFNITGKKIAVPYASTMHQQLLAYIKRNNIDEDQITIYNLEPNEIVEAWNKEKIDVAVIWPPYPRKFKGKVYKKMVDMPDKEIPSFLGLLVNKNLNRRIQEQVINHIYNSNKLYNTGISGPESILKNEGYLVTNKNLSLVNENFYPNEINQELRLLIKKEISETVNFLYSVKKINYKRDLSEQIRI